MVLFGFPVSEDTNRGVFQVKIIFVITINHEIAAIAVSDHKIRSNPFGKMDESNPSVRHDCDNIPRRRLSREAILFPSVWIKAVFLAESSKAVVDLVVISTVQNIVVHQSSFSLFLRQIPHTTGTTAMRIEARIFPHLGKIAEATDSIGSCPWDALSRSLN